MKIQCDACETNLATVMCCADEAALCADCDARIHAANKLSTKHVRVSLLTAPEPAKCDICQVSSHSLTSPLERFSRLTCIGINEHASKDRNGM